jgi:hypothetical protein
MLGLFAKQPLRAIVLSAVLATSLFIVTPAYAAPGPCDGTPADDPPITCSTDPTPDDQVGLGLGDDTYVQDAGVTSGYVGGDADEDGFETSGNGGDDHITINGTVTSCVDGDNVDGDGGNDTIIINGVVQCYVFGDYVEGNGGNDTITINGEVDHSVYGDEADLNGGNDTIVVNGEVGEDVYGDNSSGTGGNDTITINGTVHADVIGDDSGLDGGDDTITINGVVGGHVTGDFSSGDGGDDIIIINGTVTDYVLGDNVGGAGGDDRVELGENAVVGGDIDGEDGFDTLVFKFLYQEQVNALGLDPAGDSLTYNGHTYNWFNFERLLGTLQDAAARLRTLFAGSGFLAVDAVDGVKVFQGDRLIAFIPYASLRSLDPGDAPLRYQSLQSAGWYVTVSNQGPLADQPSLESFLVTVFTPSGVQALQFTFSD